MGRFQSSGWNVRIFQFQGLRSAKTGRSPQMKMAPLGALITFVVIGLDQIYLLVSKNMVGKSTSSTKTSYARLAGQCRRSDIMKQPWWLIKGKYVFALLRRRWAILLSIIYLSAYFFSQLIIVMTVNEPWLVVAREKRKPAWDISNRNRECLTWIGSGHSTETA